MVSMANCAPSSPQSKPICHHRGRQCQKHVRRHSPSCFSADLCRCTLQKKTSSTQNPCLRTRCSMMAMDVQEVATSTGARKRRNWESEVSTQQDPERLRLSTWRMREGRTVTFGEFDPSGRDLATPCSRRMCPQRLA